MMTGFHEALRDATAADFDLLGGVGSGEGWAAGSPVPPRTARWLCWWWTRPATGSRTWR